MGFGVFVFRPRPVSYDTSTHMYIYTHHLNLPNLFAGALAWSITVLLYSMKFVLATPRLDYPLSEIYIDQNDPGTKVTPRDISPSSIPHLDHRYIEKTSSFRFGSMSLLAISTNLTDASKNDLSKVTIYECLENEDYRLLLEFEDVTKTSSDFVVDIVYADKYLLTCSNRGLITINDLRFYNLDSASSSGLNIPVFFAQINEPVEFVSICEYENSVFTIISGGYNNNLALYDLNPSYHNFQVNNKVPSKIDENGTDSSSSSPLYSIVLDIISDRPYICAYKSIVKVSPIWKVKNIPKNDEFTWIKSAIFLYTLGTNSYNSVSCSDNSMETNRTKEYSIISITNFGKLNIYNNALSRQPIETYTLSNHSLIFVKQLSLTRIIFADCLNTIGIFDLSRVMITETYKVPIGSISSILASNLFHPHVTVPSCISMTRTKSNSSNFSLNSLSSEDNQSPYHRRKRQMLSDPRINVLVFIASIDKTFKCYRLLNENKFNLIFSKKLSSIVPDMALVDTEASSDLFIDAFDSLDFTYYNKKSSSLLFNGAQSINTTTITTSTIPINNDNDNNDKKSALHTKA